MVLLPLSNNAAMASCVHHIVSSAYITSTPSALSCIWNIRNSAVLFRISNLFAIFLLLDLVTQAHLSTTVSSQFAVRLLPSVVFADMVQIPAFKHWTSPLSLITVATFSALDDHQSYLHSAFPSPSRDRKAPPACMMFVQTSANSCQVPKLLLPIISSYFYLYCYYHFYVSSLHHHVLKVQVKVQAVVQVQVQAGIFVTCGYKNFLTCGSYCPTCGWLVPDLCPFQFWLVPFLIATYFCKRLVGLSGIVRLRVIPSCGSM